MGFEFKPFLDAIPSISSAYSLIAFVLLLLSVLIYSILKTDGPIFKLIEKKLTKAHTFTLLYRLSLFAFIFAIFVFLLGYIHELGKLYKYKSSQTSILIYDKSFDISDSCFIKGKRQVGYFIASDPSFSIPAPNLAEWEKPIWVNRKEDLEKYFRLSLPKEIEFKGPFWDFLSSGKLLFLTSKHSTDLEINKYSSIEAQSPFDIEKGSNYPYEEPFVLHGSHHLAIFSILKSDLPVKFKKVNIAGLTAFYMNEFSISPDQLIATKENAVITTQGKFINATYQNKKQDLSIFKCVRLIDSGSYFFLIEGICYAPESNLEARDYITNVIFKFALPNA